MEPMSLADAARTVLVYIAPLIAAGALAKIGEDATDTATEMLGRVWDALGRRFQGHRKAEAALTTLEDEPQSQDVQQRVERHIVEVFGRDPAASAELIALAREVAALGPSPGPQRQHTQIIGGNANVGAAVAGDVHGGLTIGSLDLSRGKRAPAGVRPPASLPAPTPRGRVDDATLSADGVHFSFGHAVVIGVADYADPRLRVAGGTTASDARALATLLRDPQLAAYPSDQVRVLLDAKATRANILDALEELAHKADGGTALIFFAGHGEPTGGSYALLPYDAELKRLAETGLTAEVFHKRVAKVRERARRLIVLLNCCHAGGVGDEVLGDNDGASGTAPPPEFYRPLATGSGQVIISSSRPSQKSGARSKADPRHTPFGAQLLAALRGGAPGAGPALGVFDLFAHLRVGVPADARHIRYRGSPLVQEPLFYASQLDDNLAVALRPAGGTLGVGLGDLARRLAELELQIEATGDAVPAALLAERDEVLRALGSEG